MAWLGVRAGALNLLLPVGDIAEVLPVAACTAVPHTLPWFRGLSNVRGSLYSVLDLSALMGYAPVATGAEARLLLLVPARMRNTALMVNRQVGMQDGADWSACEGALPRGATGAGPASSALGRRWRDVQGSVWQELDLLALIGLPAFLDVAATVAVTGSAA